MSEEYGDFIKYFTLKLADLLVVTNSFAEVFMPFYYEVSNWFIKKEKEVATELKRVIPVGGVKSRILSMFPVICTWFPAELIMYIFEPNKCNVVVGYDVVLDVIRIYGLCGDIGSELLTFGGYRFIDRDVSVYRTELPELGLFVASLHTERKLRDLIWPIFEKVGFDELFKGINITFKPTYGITENARLYLDGRLDVEFTFSKAYDFFVDVTNEVHRAELHDFGKIIGEKHLLEFVEINYVNMGGCLKVRLSNDAAYNTYVQLYSTSYYDERKFKPIDLIRLLDLMTTALVYYSIIIAKMYENYRRLRYGGGSTQVIGLPI